MRNSIGGAWLFTLVTIFILLFSSYLAVTIVYSKTFKLKNGVIDIIEINEGYDEETIEAIGVYLDSNSYAGGGNCPVGWIGAKDSGDAHLTVEINNENKKDKYEYCVKKHNEYNIDTGNKHIDEAQRSYYSVRLFFNFDLPLFADFFAFSVNGETTQIMYPGDYYKWKNFYE